MQETQQTMPKPRVPKPNGRPGRPKITQTAEIILEKKLAQNARCLAYSRANRDYINQTNLDNYYKRKAVRAQTLMTIETPIDRLE